MAILEDLETSKCKNGPPNDLFYGFPGAKILARGIKILISIPGTRIYPA